MDCGAPRCRSVLNIGEYFFSLFSQLSGVATCWQVYKFIKGHNFTESSDGIFSLTEKLKILVAEGMIVLSINTEDMPNVHITNDA